MFSNKTPACNDSFVGRKTLYVSELNTSDHLPESYIKNSMYRRSDLYSWYAVSFSIFHHAAKKTARSIIDGRKISENKDREESFHERHWAESTFKRYCIHIEAVENSYHWVDLVHTWRAPFIYRVDELWKMLKVSCHFCCHHHVDDCLTNRAKLIPAK